VIDISTMGESPRAMKTYQTVYNEGDVDSIAERRTQGCCKIGNTPAACPPKSKTVQIQRTGVGTVFIASAVEIHHAWRALSTGIAPHGGRDEYGPYLGCFRGLVLI
jgi:hypothetical protein